MKMTMHLIILDCSGYISTFKADNVFGSKKTDCRSKKPVCRSMKSKKPVAKKSKK